MARSVTQAEVVKCVLDEWDPDGEEWVKIKQARGREEKMRDRLFSKTAIERNTEEGVIRELYELSGAELVMRECFLTFVDASLTIDVPIPDTDKVEKKLLFKPGMSEAEFEASWNTLDPELMDEWWRHVRAVNPHWSPYGKVAVQKK
jgi:hypothetical protein